MSFQIDQILIIGALVFFVFYVSVLRTNLTDRLLYFISALLGVILVINPELANRIAQAVGIGRGADLLLYLFILVSLFYFAGLRADIKRLNRQLTAIVREIALQNPQNGQIDENNEKS